MWQAIFILEKLSPPCGVPALVDSCAVHAARDTYTFDMSILILVHLNQKVMCRGGLRDVLAHLPLVTIRPSQAAALSVIRGSEGDGNEGRELGSHPCGRDDYGVQRERSGITRAASRYATGISPLLPSLPNAGQME